MAHIFSLVLNLRLARLGSKFWKVQAYNFQSFPVVYTFHTFDAILRVSKLLIFLLLLLKTIFLGAIEEHI
jgi:hypothetical protein